MNAESMREGLRKISRRMDENREYLIQLDQQNGDGDLGVSMSEGFRARQRAWRKRGRRIWESCL